MRILEAVRFDLSSCPRSMDKDITAEIDTDVRVFFPPLFKKEQIACLGIFHTQGFGYFH